MYSSHTGDSVTTMASTRPEECSTTARLLGRSEIDCEKLLQALPVAVYTTDALGHITYFNEAAATLWGYCPELGATSWCGSWRLFWPDGRPMGHDQCPMAVALKEGRRIYAAEAIAEHPDGTRTPFLAYPTPVWDRAGVLVGAINTLVDISERKKAEYESRWLSAIVESSDEAIVSKDLRGIVTSWNAGAETLFGYRADEMIGRPIGVIIPGEQQDEETRILAQILKGSRVEPYETVRRRRDGSLVDVWLAVSPIKSADGRIIGASKIARDITERRQAQAKQRLLVKEMCHRVKNLFTLASGVVALNARSAATPKELANSVRERLVALARAHQLTQPDLSEDTEIPEHKVATLAALVHTILAPYLGGAEFLVRVTGPEVTVEGSAVTSLALFLHEIVTNAAKYGALSTATGEVEISWRLDDEDLLMTWRERGGPRLYGPPISEGFGGQLIKVTVTSQLGGKIRREWTPDGLVVDLSVPLVRLRH